MAAMALLGVMLCTSRSPAMAADAPQTRDDSSGAVQPAEPPAQTIAYPVSRFELAYVRENPGHPPIDELMQVEVSLRRTDEGYDAAPSDPAAIDPREIVTIRLADFSADPPHPPDSPDSPAMFRPQAIRSVLDALLDELVRRQLMGVLVSADPEDIDDAGVDLRPPGRTILRLSISTGVVTDLRTLASGERIEARERVNHPLHARLRERSPIQPRQAGPAGQAPPADLLRKDKLDEYLFLLSRHPGRRVDAAVSAAAEPGSVALDYLVTENKPLVIYGQVSNTGTRQTSYWRERFGLIHNQLTNNDDILSLDYITAGFDETHAVVASYEAPVATLQRLRWRAFGTWSQFAASEVGFFNDVFTGDSWSAGGELSWNFHQQRELFLDLVGGARFEHVAVDNRAIDLRGEEDFVIPSIGARLERATAWFDTRASLVFEFQHGAVTNVNEAELDRLGRFDPDADWQVLRFAASHSFFLEPLLNYEAWRDPLSPESSTLAHEIALSIRGQYAFDNRLIPQQVQTAGGLYSVRGYPESIVAGDSGIIASAEYRFHLPRIFGIEPEPRDLIGQPFRWAPQQVYGRPDWDLILRGFIDVARIDNSNPFSFEDDETLLGTGVGIELLLRRNVNLRLDWGMALMDARDGEVNDGSNRLHFVATILF